MQSEALGQLGQVGPTVEQAIESQTGELTQPLADTADQTAEAGSAWVAETQSQVGEVTAALDGGLAQITEGTGSGLDSMLQQGQSQAGAEVDRISEEAAGQVAQIQDSVDGGVGEATTNLQSGVDAGTEHASTTLNQATPAMNEAAAAQGSWYSALGHWVSSQLSQLWEAFTSIFSLGFLIDLAVGIVTAVAVAALVIAAAALIGVTGGLALALVVGIAAGAAGFAAAQMSANVRNGDPLMQGVGHAAILGAFVGGAAALGTFYGLGLAAGTGLVMLGAGIGTIVANVSTGRAPDDHLLANIVILGIFHAVVKAVSDRLPSRRTTPTETDRETTPYQRPPGAPEIVVESPSRVTATDFVDQPDGGWICYFVDPQTGARFGYAEVEAGADGRPNGGPHLTLDPQRARMPDGSPVVLKASGFSWTPEALRVAIEAFRRKFGSQPANMDGLLAWSNLVNFQQAFARIRAANPNLSLRMVAEQAAREISFGKHRIALGYGDISVEFGNIGDITLPNGTVLSSVPRWVEVQARPTLPRPQMPPPHPDDGNYND
jgi:hypothetical protein